MDISINITLELGAKTIALLSGDCLEHASIPSAGKTVKSKTELQNKPIAKKVTLDTIKEEVTKILKNKKGQVIKRILKEFNAGSISNKEPLNPKYYEDFYERLLSYNDCSTTDSLDNNNLK